jgi:hypothetical protein
VWANAHTRKNGNTGGLEDVSGSTQRTGQADTVLMLKGEKVDGRTVSTRVTFAKLREDPDDFPMPVTFSICDGRVQISSTMEDDTRPLEAQIVDQLHTGGKTKNALCSALKRSGKDIEGALTILFTAGSIVTDWATVRGKQTKLFKLRSPTP